MDANELERRRLDDENRMLLNVLLWVATAVVAGVPLAFIAVTVGMTAGLAVVNYPITSAAFAGLVLLYVGWRVVVAVRLIRAGVGAMPTQDNTAHPAWVREWRRRLDIINKVLLVGVWIMRAAVAVVAVVILWRLLTA